jgi:hypothetical protein
MGTAIVKSRHRCAAPARGARPFAGDTYDLEPCTLGERPPRDGIEAEPQRVGPHARQLTDLEPYRIHLPRAAAPGCIRDNLDHAFRKRHLVHVYTATAVMRYELNILCQT